MSRQRSQESQDRWDDSLLIGNTLSPRGTSWLCYSKLPHSLVDPYDAQVSSPESTRPVDG